MLERLYAVAVMLLVGLPCVLWKRLPELLLEWKFLLRSESKPEPSGFYRYSIKVFGWLLVGIAVFVLAVSLVEWGKGMI